MDKGWVVVKFENHKAQTVFFSWEKFEVQEKAEDLNEAAPEGVWYGWERNK